MVALKSGATMPASTVNQTTFRGRSKAYMPLAYRFTSVVAMMASNVFPVAIPVAPRMLPAVVIFTKNAPARIAGQR